MQAYLSDATEVGDYARSFSRDPCWPDATATFDQMAKHLLEAHGNPEDALWALNTIYWTWRDAVLNQIIEDDRAYRTKFPPRQPIMAAAAESGLQVNRNGMTYCWNDTGPTKGHFNGNREPSMKLYETNDSFFCHQCGIWGWSDQLKERTWQGKKR